MAPRPRQQDTLRTHYADSLAHALLQASRRCPSVDTSRVFDEMLDDAVARLRYRFTVNGLRQLSSKLQLPVDGVRTTEGDNVPPVEALAMVCRRLSEASKLFTVASEFGRSTAAYSRVLRQQCRFGMTITEIYCTSTMPLSKSASTNTAMPRMLQEPRFVLAGGLLMAPSNAFPAQVLAKNKPLQMKISKGPYIMDILGGTVSTGRVFKLLTGL